MKSYITGSRAYGTPTEESDYDLVIAVTTEEANLISQAGTSPNACYPSTHFGKLNLIIFRSDVPEDMLRYYRWKQAHDTLMLEKPVTRERAVEVHKSLKTSEFDFKDELYL